MKKIWGVILALLVVGALFLLLKTNPPGKPVPANSPPQVSSTEQPGNSAGPGNPSGTAASASPTGAEATSSPRPPVNLAANAGMVESATVTAAPDISPEIVLQNVRHAITQYGTMFGGNPIGTNPEITAALAGNNPKQVNFIKPENGMQINGNGEMVDDWGTPLFFHQLSGTDTEVRSAGPDRKMWTPDDLMTR